MNKDFSPVAAGGTAAIDVVCSNEKRVGTSSVRCMPPTLLNIQAQIHDCEAAGHA